MGTEIVFIYNFCLANMSEIKQSIIKFASVVRPTFGDLPEKGTSQWYAVYSGYDTRLNLIGLNDIRLKLAATSKEIRYNCKRILTREDGKYTEIVGSGVLNPMGKKWRTLHWCKEDLAGLPIVSLDIVNKGNKETLRGAFICMLQIEATHINP